MNSTLKREKLLRILNHIAEQEEKIRGLDLPGYYKFIEVAERCKSDINTFAEKDIDDLVQFFEKSVKIFKKKDIKKKDIKKKDIEKLEKLEEDLIKASVHSIEQRFGKPHMPGQLSFELIENRELIKEAKNLDIKIIGWDLTRAEDMAIFAIQKLYSKYGYVNKKDNSLAFTHADYYEAYGVKKWKNKKGEQIFSGSGKRQAIRALLSLSWKKCITAYSQLDTEATKKKGEKIFNRIEAISSIIREVELEYEGLKETEFYNGKSKINKLKAIRIVPSTVLFDQIENYYILLPSNFYTEIKEKLPSVKNKHLPMFLQLLAREIALERRRNFKRTHEISFKKLSYILRMDNWIKANKKKRADDRIIECFKQAKTLEYLKDFKITKGKTVSKKAIFQININKFRPQRKVKEIIDNSYKEEEYTYKPISKETREEAWRIMAKFSPKYREKLEGLEGEKE